MKKVKKAKSGLKSRIPKSMKNPKRGIILNRKKQTVPKVKKTGVQKRNSDTVRATGVMSDTMKSNAKKNKMKTKKQVALAALKKAPFGSAKRRKIYEVLGYKQDNTTTGYKKAKSSVKKTGATKVTPKSKVVVKKKTVTANKGTKNAAKKVSKTRAKGKAALASGNRRKALRMKKREARKTQRVAKRTARRSKRK